MGVGILPYQLHPFTSPNNILSTVKTIMLLITLIAAIAVGASYSPAKPRGFKLLGQPDIHLVDTYELRNYQVGDTVTVYWNDMTGDYYITASPEDELAVIVP
jgi:hypothetical protein